jgi:hypothetical protein
LAQALLYTDELEKHNNTENKKIKTKRIQQRFNKHTIKVEEDIKNTMVANRLTGYMDQIVKKVIKHTMVLARKSGCMHYLVKTSRTPWYWIEL